MSQVEQRLRELFEFDASRAPSADGLASGARDRVRRRRRRLVSIGGVAVLALALTGAASRWPGPPDPGASRVGPLPDAASTSCAYSYSPQEVARRAYALDGTVIRIGPTHPAAGGLPAVRVTFHVNQWFHGGSGDSVAVEISSSWEDGPPAFQVGTRLLVSGAPGHAWGCGFTRYYDPATATGWADASR